MRPVHAGLAAVILAVLAVGYFEARPRLDDFDPSLHAASRDNWAGRLHIAYMEKWGSFEREACQAMVDQFNQSQTEIFVHYINTGEADRKSMLAIMGNDPPDVVGLWSRNVPLFGEAEALMPLDDLMAQTGPKPEDYIDNYLQLGRYQGKTYALPTTPGSLALFYNKEHFRRKAQQLRQAGLDPDRPPATIEEFDRYAEVLSEFNPDGSPKVMGFLPTEPKDWFDAAWGYHFGGQLYDPATNRITTDSPENIRAFTWIKRYAEMFGRQKMLQFVGGFGNFDSPTNAFIDGKVSMEMQGVWFPNFIRRHRPDLEFGVAPFPCVEGVPGPRSMIDGDVIAIPRGSRHPEAAWKFIQFVQDPNRGLATLNRLQGKHMPVRNTPEVFRQSHPNLELKIFEEIAASKHSFLLPQITIWAEYSTAIDNAFQHIWNWPVPEDQLAGLSGAQRQKKVEELCQAEVHRTLTEVRVKMQARLDQTAERQKLRDAGR